MVRNFKSSFSYTKRKYNGFTIYGIRYSAYDRPERYDVVFNGKCYASFDRQLDAIKWIAATDENKGRYRVGSEFFGSPQKALNCATATKKTVEIYHKEVGKYLELNMASFEAFVNVKPYAL